jgi:hypothetical protein
MAVRGGKALWARRATRASRVRPGATADQAVLAGWDDAERLDRTARRARLDRRDSPAATGCPVGRASRDPRGRLDGGGRRDRLGTWEPQVKASE